MWHVGPLPPAARCRARPLRPARVGVRRFPPRRSRNAISSARCRTPRGSHRRSGRRSRVRVVDPKGVRPRRSRGARARRIRTRSTFVPFSCSGPLLLKAFFDYSIV